MKKRRVIMVVVAGCLVLVAAALVVLLPNREPRYNGRSLSEWISRCDINALEDNGNYDATHRSPKEAAAAVRHIGTNGLPCLLKWICYQPSPWKSRIYPLLHWLPHALIPSSIEDNGAELPWLAVEGFEILGPVASPAIPELMGVMKDTNTPGDTVVIARDALSSVGIDALAPVLAAVGDPNCPNRGQFVWAIYWMGVHHLGAKGTAAVPLLLRSLKDKDLEVACGAAASLGVLKLEPDLVVPALVECLKDSDARLRISAAASLRHFADQARSAVPSLVRALNDKDPRVTEAASNTLYTIDPKSLEKAVSP